MLASVVGFAANRHILKTSQSYVELYILVCCTQRGETMRVSNPRPKPDPMKNKLSMELAWCNLYPGVTCAQGFMVGRKGAIVRFVTYLTKG